VTATLLLLPLAFAAGDVRSARIDSRAERTFYVLAELTPAEARRLEGTRARFRVVLDSLEDDATHSWDCVAPDGLHASVFLLAGEEAADEMTVEARLVVIDHRPGFGFLGFHSLTCAFRADHSGLTPWG
jgi:hypothetical protein